MVFFLRIQNKVMLFFLHIICLLKFIIHALPYVFYYFLPIINCTFKNIIFIIIIMNRFLLYYYYYYLNIIIINFQNFQLIHQNE